jgi:hypothetical protein
MMCVYVRGSNGHFLKERGASKGCDLCPLTTSLLRPGGGGCNVLGVVKERCGGLVQDSVFLPRTYTHIIGRSDNSDVATTVTYSSAPLIQMPQYLLLGGWQMGLFPNRPICHPRCFSEKAWTALLRSLCSQGRGTYRRTRPLRGLPLHGQELGLLDVLNESELSSAYGS